MNVTYTEEIQKKQINILSTKIESCRTYSEIELLQKKIGTYVDVIEALRLVKL